MPWIGGNFYLTRSQMENNATIILSFFGRVHNWSISAVAAMCGNMQSESTINPGIWENLDEVAKGGYGLVQWTPYTNYADWAGSDWENNGTKEMQRIIYELENGLQWIKTAMYPMSFREFTTSTETPELLAQAWLYNYERPESLDQPWRSTQAREWFEYFGGHPASSIPVWLMFKMKGGK